MKIQQLKNYINNFLYRHRYCWGIYQITDFKNWIRNLIWPRQRWVLNGVGRDWHDKPELLIKVMFNFIIDFVEKEKAFETINWNSDALHQNAAQFIKNCYSYIKEVRPKLEKEIEEIISRGYVGFGKDYWDKIQNKTYEELYPGLEAKEKELEDRDSFYLKGIVDFRALLWT